MTTPPPPAPSHANRQLFSDHYLNVRLPARPDWAALAAEAEPVRRAIREVLAGYTPSANEAQTEDGLIKPVLKLLGHVFEVQAPLATPDGTQKPDYILYGDAAALVANRGRKLTEDLLAGRALAVADAKYWDRPLDVALRSAAGGAAGDPFTNRNPSYQIAFYVQHSGLDWGILTNGRLWRLYHRDTAHKLDRFYEVDLVAAAEADDGSGNGARDGLGNGAAFLYFYLFFRRAAFDPGPLSLAALLAASADYARGVSDTLKRQVYDALRHIAQGFLDHPANGLAADGHAVDGRAVDGRAVDGHAVGGREVDGRAADAAADGSAAAESIDAATLSTIYDQSLRVLYRLLFLLYAEAGGLLPVRANAMYRDVYSLKAIKEAVKADLDAGRRPLASTAVLWTRLSALFGIIDAGSAELGVPPYNGGLFAAKAYPFLAQNAVGDAHLQRAIDKLARVGGDFVDYQDLSVRHLGTIYEGLLEFHLAPLAESESGDGLRWTVALVNDKGERKATGSYYTPDYIVKYMVDRTVGPALAEAVAGAADDRARAEAVLNLNVVDPAMGSGHFLVEVVEAIARTLVALDVAPGADVSSGEVAGETDLAYWKRRVAQNCVYGVDLNPLAVDLAKLSLWLTTVSRTRPLSFLDHHLRPGNALVGARLDDLATASASPRDRRHPAGSPRRRLVSTASATHTPPDAAGDPTQLSMLDDEGFRRSLSVAVSAMWLIEGTAGDTMDEVRTQERLYAELREELTRKYARLADLTTATHFGLAVDAALWRPLVNFATGRTLAASPRFAEWVAEAKAFAARHRPFHWELEFPEVFVDRHGQPLGDRGGFDVVIGNPPYIRQEQLAAFKPYLQAKYGDVYAGTADIFVYFFGRGLALLKEGGRLAFISSNSWLRANYATPLRAHLRTAASVEEIVDLGDNRIFTDAPDVYPAIQVVRRSPPSADHTAQAAIFTRGEGVADFAAQVTTKRAPVSIHDQQNEGWQLGDDAGRRLFRKLIASGRSLMEVVDGQMYRGVLTGLNEAFIVDESTRNRLVEEDPECDSIIKPLVNGEDVRPWHVKREGRWLILLPDGWTENSFGKNLVEAQAWQEVRRRYPSIADHLSPFSEAARRRADKGAYWWELRPCNYYDKFDGEKILWPEMAKSPRFAIAEPRVVGNKTTFMIPGAWAYELGLLMSRATWFAITKLCVPIGERGGLLRYTLSSQFISRLPIPTAPTPDRDAIAALATAITAAARERYGLHERVRRRIAADLGGAGGGKLNQKLTAWWGLDFGAFRAQVGVALKADIPLRERDAWDGWLAEQRAAHAAHTAEIVRLETDLNRRVYALFDLTADEVRMVEEATKYRYGEV